MPIRKSVFTIKGMTRDTAVSKFSPDFAYENQNLRIIATDDNTSYGLVNEKGTAGAIINGLDTGTNFISGIPIGQEVINDTLVLFTTENQGSRVVTINGIEGGATAIPTLSGDLTIEDDITTLTDHIYKFKVNSSGNLVCTPLYHGNLGFDPGCPIESIGVYENEELQKVYWVDGINQPRVINIAASSSVRGNWNNNSFNFVRRVSFNASPTVARDEVSFGSFAPGVIQYCFTFYSLYGAESNIVYTTPLYYVSHSNRGANPDDVVSCSFNITIPEGFYKHVSGYDYIRIYSIHRTSMNATPKVRKVADLSMKVTSDSITGILSYIDTGIGGESIDPTQLLYIGGDPIIAGTLSQKDNTLFLGDIILGRNPINPAIKARTAMSPVLSTVTTQSKFLSLPEAGISGGHYGYTSELSKSNSQITYFKRGETYRLGFQAQHYTGKWSDVVWIGDYTVNTGISSTTVGGQSGVNLVNLRATVTDNDDVLTNLVSDGYISIRPVVVFPGPKERSIICQGVLCPTVYNVEDRYSNAPFAQASWFFRPNAPSTVPNPGNYALSSNDLYGRWAEFRHNRPIPGNDEPNAEIQCIANPPSDPRGTSAMVSRNREAYFVDQSIVTMHSPDVEFGDELKNLDVSNVGLRIVGYVPIDSCYSDIDIEATAPSNYIENYDVSEHKWSYYSTIAPGFIKTQISADISNRANGWRSLLSGPMWFDEVSNNINSNWTLTPVGFIVYPWHRSGALNNTRAAASQSEATSVLKHKKMSLTRFSRNSEMFTPQSVGSGVSEAVTFNSDQVTMVKLKAPYSGIPDIVYYGNVDKLLSVHNVQTVMSATYTDVDTDIKMHNYGSLVDLPVEDIQNAAYPIMIVNPDTTFQRTPIEAHDTALPWSVDDINEIKNIRISGTVSYRDLFQNPYVTLDGIRTTLSNNQISYEYIRYVHNKCSTHATDPVNIKYKSSPHIVMALKYENGNTQQVLPRHSNVNSVEDLNNSVNFFWNSGGTAVNKVRQGTISISPSGGYLWLGELYRTVDSSVLFGGTSDEAIESNNWIPAGEPISIVNSSNSPLSSVSLVWDQGDTYYQRYDCLKTYPFTLEDPNSVTDILSFMCETRVNIDGRYDRNRGKLSNLYTTPTNYNLFNPVYSQPNNFFNYRGLNPNKVQTTVYPNTITWSKTKTMGETIDTWTNITLASTLDLDGDKGRIRALRRFDNQLLAFQDRGVSQILYNESVQISSTAGVPIEIANSGKVSGKRYISNHIGCVNKWSICSAPTGIYFMDDIGKDIYLFNGQLNNISDKHGFHSWVIGNFPNIKVWNPRDFDTAGEITYYDKVNGDVMFITKDNSLALSEPLGQFSSFYSYGKTPYFATLGDRGVMWHKDNSIEDGEENYNKYRAWWYREGYYNSFFNVYHPFSVTIIANEHPTEDKIFNNLEYRGDTFDISGNYLPANTFDTLQTWNEYQTGLAELSKEDDVSKAYASDDPLTVSNIPSELRKKFRIWRANIPRNTSSTSYKRDRMRNPWLYIKLSKENSNNYKTILHDLVVYYYE